jgi:hypothetical protein
VSTYERVRRGLTRLLGEPFAIRLNHGGNPRPMTLPLVTLTTRHDMAMVIPTVGNTFERTPGNRARDAATEPYDVVCAEDGPRAVVLPNRANNVPKLAEYETAPPILTGGTVALVELQNHGQLRDAGEEPAGTMRAGGFHHAIVMRNNGDGGSSTGWESTPGIEPIRTLTAGCHQSIVVPYQSEAHYPRRAGADADDARSDGADRSAVDRAMPRDARTEPSFVQTTETRPSLLEVPK